MNQQKNRKGNAMVALLDDDQLSIIMQQGPLFDQMAPLLNEPLQKALMDFQIRVGDTYIAGTWDVPTTGETFTNPDCPHPPTVNEAQSLLAQACLALPPENPLKNAVISIMRALGLPPVGTTAQTRQAAKPSLKEP